MLPIDDGVRDVGTMHGLAKAQAEQGARLSGMRERAGKFARIEAKLRHDEGALNELQAKVDAEMSKGGVNSTSAPLAWSWRRMAEHDGHV